MALFGLQHTEIIKFQEQSSLKITHYRVDFYLHICHIKTNKQTKPKSNLEFQYHDNPTLKSFPETLITDQWLHFKTLFLTIKSTE